jgi:mono/diheme cytochrome c family protein
VSRARTVTLTITLCAALVACSSPAAPPPTRPAVAIAPAAPGRLLAPAAFDAIEDRRARSQALFGEIGRVLAHPRCVNCHPADDTPRQGDAHAFHDPPVHRGPTGRGVPAMQCGTCHQERNAELARLPGAPGWHLAPASMAWLGKTVPEICVQLGDSARNGGRTLPQILDHLAHDGIVAWGWAPGANRVPAPGTQAELAALFAAWLETGAVCP